MLKPDVFILFISVLLTKASIEFLKPLPPEVEAVVNKSVTLECVANGEQPLHILWVKDGEPVIDKHTWGLAHGNELRFDSVQHEDTGEYTCIAQNAKDRKTLTTSLKVTSCPGKLTNVSVHPSTVVATVSWHAGYDGGSPVNNYTILFHQIKPQLETTWHRPIPENTSPTLRQVDLFNLKPNCTYELRIWANNKNGAGDIKTVQFSTTPAIDEMALVRHMLADQDEYTVTAWILAVSIVLGTLVILCIASCVLLYKDWKRSQMEDGRYYETDDDGNAELLSHYGGLRMMSPDGFPYHRTDENCNSHHNYRYHNNNSVIHPCRL